MDHLQPFCGKNGGARVETSLHVTQADSLAPKQYTFTRMKAWGIQIGICCKPTKSLRAFPSYTSILDERPGHVPQKYGSKLYAQLTLKEN